MLLLLLALLQAAPPEEAKATLQSCQMGEKGWVCHYQIPSTTIVRPLEASDAAHSVTASPTLPMTPLPVEPPAAAPAYDDAAEHARQTRLIARCADAKWYSPCLPGERTEARLLRDAVTLRGKVTTLLSEQRCGEAIKMALEGGDLPLAREARAFCAP
jgi:hypothetical protein